MGRLYKKIENVLYTDGNQYSISQYFSNSGKNLHTYVKLSDSKDLLGLNVESGNVALNELNDFDFIEKFLILSKEIEKKEIEKNERIKTNEFFAEQKRNEQDNRRKYLQSAEFSNIKFLAANILKHKNELPSVLGVDQILLHIFNKYNVNLTIRNENLNYWYDLCYKDFCLDWERPLDKLTIDNDNSIVNTEDFLIEVVELCNSMIKSIID